MKPLLLKHLSGESIGRFPVWAMRQAGRYLPNYREIRSHHSFWEMVTKPDVAADVSLTPLGVLPVDGIIFFSDILTLPFGVGVPIEMKEGVGPVCRVPLRSRGDFDIFEKYEAKTHTPYVSEALQKIRRQVSGEIAVLGFAGAPWTVSTYLCESEGVKKFSTLRAWMHENPQELANSLQILAKATSQYLQSQIRAGADLVQLFDTWLGEMPREFFINYYVPILNSIFDSLKSSKVPVLFYSRHAHHLLDELHRLTVDGLSCDELLPLGEIERRTERRFFLQGNLDPLLLFGSEAVVRRQTRLLVQHARTLERPAILNLGHGILPKTPVENVRAFFEEARQAWI